MPRKYAAVASICQFPVAQLPDHSLFNIQEAEPATDSHVVSERLWILRSDVIQ